MFLGGFSSHWWFSLGVSLWLRFVGCDFDWFLLILRFCVALLFFGVSEWNFVWFVWCEFWMELVFGWLSRLSFCVWAFW